MTIDGIGTKMTDDSWQNEKAAPSDEEVALDYIKANDFKTIWVDGGIGSLTPRGVIHCALYSERPAIPRRQVFTLEPTGESKATLGSEVIEKRVSRGSIVREMQCDIFLDIEAAENLAVWLLEKVQEAKPIQAIPKNEEDR